MIDEFRYPAVVVGGDLTAPFIAAGQPLGAAASRGTRGLLSPQNLSAACFEPFPGLIS